MNELIVPEMNEKSIFDYEQLDDNTSNELRSIVIKLLALNNSFKFKVGEQLYKAQELLAKKGYGCFQEWFESYGLKKDKVYNWIKFYKVYVGNSDKQKELENLVDSKIYELGKLSDKQQKQVLEEIDLKNMSVKDVKKLVKELKDRVSLMRITDKTAIEKELTPDNVKTDLEYANSQIKFLQMLYDNEKEKSEKAKEIIEKAKAKEDFGKLHNYYELELYKVKNNVKRFIEENSKFTYLKEELQDLSREERLVLQQNVDDIKNWAYLMEQALGNMQNLVGDYIIIENEETTGGTTTDE